MNLPLNAQKWLDVTLYPFDNQYIQLDAGRMHYIDEGKGDVILFVHGTPTWSFLYRDFISSLSKKYRCIAIDHIGFGLSEKPNDFDGKPQSHSKNLTAFIEKLNLKEITLVVHDFGGPIGLGTAIENSDSIKRIVMFNTWLWGTKNNPGAQKIDSVLNSSVGKFLYLRMNFSPKFLLKKGVHDKKNLSKKVHKQYIYPFPNKSSRQSLLKIGKSLIGSSDWYQNQWTRLDNLDSKPWLILWGTKDEFISLEDLQKWKKRLPKSVVVEYDCGHFVQEEHSNEAIGEIDNFMSK
ncbi:alpha/beta fold hydrolase [Lewinella cohaerens]|uniref:alpha/beta fold hydrolase n=1 Tax=Lewinella cohaerens TaxID=70995 RepID=UPI0003788669|nr:alpha/beta fold hydrolase [Lewinella cohaerens]